MRLRNLETCLTTGISVLGLSLACSSAALAFGGCINSPENPTLLLALVGGVAAGVPWLRRRLKSRRDRQDH